MRECCKSGVRLRFRNLRDEFNLPDPSLHLLLHEEIHKLRRAQNRPQIAMAKDNLHARALESMLSFLQLLLFDNQHRLFWL